MAEEKWAEGQAELAWWLSQENLARWLDHLDRGDWLALWEEEREGERARAWLVTLLAPYPAPESLLAKADCAFEERDFHPRFVRDREDTPHYQAQGNDTGLEPLAWTQQNPAAGAPRLVLSQEFQLFHRLWRDSTTGEYRQYLPEAGEEVVAGKLVGSRLLFRAGMVRRFLAAKQMCLVWCFERTRFWKETLAELPEQGRKMGEKEKDRAWSSYFNDGRGTAGGCESFSTFYGKQVIPPPPQERCGLEPFDEPEGEFQEFIVGEDEFGKVITYSCDPSLLVSGYRVGPEQPNRETPVFFRREVLRRYYERPSDYAVQDGVIYSRRRGDMALQLDNNHQKYVLVALKELSMMPFAEQQHWRAHNVRPDGSYSAAHLKRIEQAEYSEPEMADLRFRLAYQRTGEAWKKRWGFDLFHPMREPDRRLLDTVHLPLADEEQEFGRLMLALAKLLCDSLNQKALLRVVGPATNNEKRDSSRDVLERFLTEQVGAEANALVEPLRDIYTLRSQGVAHRGNKRYGQTLKKYGGAGRGWRSLGTDLLEAMIALLEVLGTLKPKPESLE